MPTVVKRIPPGKIEKKVKLADVPIGAVIRFSHYTFEDAIAGVEGAHFWMVIASVPKDTDRVSVVSNDGKEARKFDASHMVIIHQTSWDVAEAEMVDA